MPFRVNNWLPDPAVNANTLYFGNFGYYMLRMVNVEMMLSFFGSPEGKAFKQAFVGFKIAYGRFVGGFPNPANDAVECVKYLKQAAS